MSAIEPNDYRSLDSYYIPQQYVLKPASLTTRMRVVSYASAKGSLGVSLNVAFFTEPKLQKDIVVILRDFRHHPIALKADVRQMCRQILSDPQQRIYGALHTINQFKNFV